MRRRRTSDVLRDRHFTTRKSTIRDWNHDAKPDQDALFRARARNWFFFHAPTETSGRAA